MKHYWSQPNIDHDCKKSNCLDLTEEDIIEMQTIDADCNDCKFFKREKCIKEIDGVTEEKIKLGKFCYWTGQCLKFNCPTKAFPCNSTGHSCFEHRKK